MNIKSFLGLTGYHRWFEGIFHPFNSINPFGQQKCEVQEKDCEKIFNIWKTYSLILTNPFGVVVDMSFIMILLRMNWGSLYH